MSNETFWPSLSERMPAASTAVACTNTSLPPPSGAMKPKPLAVLKNFTVPIVIFGFSRGSEQGVPMNDHNPLSQPSRDRDAARKRAQNHFVVREQRDSAIRQEINRQRADTDAKT